MSSFDDVVGPTLTPSQASDPALTPTAAATDSGTQSDRNNNNLSSIAGYQLTAVIGRGGMGEVTLARDLSIGRDVALKRIRGDAGGAELRARFLREAQVQARLEHPAIVPVHALGEDAAGQPYFTMKRLTGRTLAELLAAPEAPSRQRLLRVFAEVCQAIEFAHTHAVVHRDLKPANIMLGDFGEVYVLDWGVARVLDEVEGPVVHSSDIASLGGATVAGTLLGTPGYMAPEQVRAASDVGRAADVYALGAILFELLAGEALHPRGAAALATTVGGIDGSPAMRVPDRGVPPELDALCNAALVQNPEARPTARALAERVQEFLDGDRDVAQRRTLAAAQIAAAQAVLNQQSENPDHGRAEAMRLAGRALALDPESRIAADLVSSLMLTAPRTLPAPVVAMVAASDLLHAKQHAASAARAYLSYFLFLPFLLTGTVRSWPLVGGTFAVVAALAAIAMLPGIQERTRLRFAVTGNAVLLLLFSRLFSPLLLLPAVLAAIVSSLITYPSLVDRPARIIVPLVACFLVPIAFELLGVWPPTWHLVNGTLVIAPTAISFDGPVMIALLISANAAIILIAGLFARRLAISRRAALRQLEVQAWQLRQLLPDDASTATR